MADDIEYNLDKRRADVDITEELSSRARAMRQARYYSDAECLNRASQTIENLRSEIARLDPSRDATRVGNPDSQPQQEAVK